METEILRQDFDPKLVEKILKARGWGKDRRAYVERCLGYNMMTVRQFADLLGKDSHTVTERTKPKIDKMTNKIYTYLDAVTPFKNMETTGPIFILVNEKAMKYLDV